MPHVGMGQKLASRKANEQSERGLDLHAQHASSKLPGCAQQKYRRGLRGDLLRVFVPADISACRKRRRDCYKSDKRDASDIGGCIGVEWCEQRDAHEEDCRVAMQEFLRKVNSDPIRRGQEGTWLAGAMLLNHYSRQTAGRSSA